jgi:peptide/nickel transport system substrate-binding protein
VSKVVLTADSNVGDIDKLLQAGTADARADTGVQTAFQSQILTDPKLKANADDPVLAATRYMAVIPSVIPNIHCRRAIFYAWDKAAAVRVFGGPTAGVVATSMTPPGIESYDPTLNPYPSGPDATGDETKARQELKLCGKPNGFTTKFAYGSPSETGPYLFRAERQALGRVGIRFTFGALSSSYFCTNGSPETLRRDGIGLLSMTLTAAYPTGYGLYRPDHARFPCLQDDDTDLTRLHNQTIDRVLRGATRGRTTDADWQALDPGRDGDGDEPAARLGEDALLPQPADDERHVRQRARGRDLRLRQHRRQTPAMILQLGSL